MKKLLAVILALVFVLAPVVAVASFDTNKAVQGDIIGIQQASCAGVLILRVATQVDDNSYVIFVNTESDRAVLVWYDAAGNMVEAAFGKMAEGPKFKAEFFLTLEQVKKQYPSPCDWIVGKEA